MDAWRTRAVALPQLFGTARAEAGKVVEPKMRHVKLASGTLRTDDDVRAPKTEQEQVEHTGLGPVVVN